MGAQDQTNIYLWKYAGLFGKKEYDLDRPGKKPEIFKSLWWHNSELRDAAKKYQKDIFNYTGHSRCGDWERFSGVKFTKPITIEGRLVELSIVLMISQINELESGRFPRTYNLTIMGREMVTLYLQKVPAEYLEFECGEEKMREEHKDTTIMRAAWQTGRDIREVKWQLRDSLGPNRARRPANRQTPGHQNRGPRESSPRPPSRSSGQTRRKEPSESGSRDSDTVSESADESERGESEAGDDDYYSEDDENSCCCGLHWGYWLIVVLGLAFCGALISGVLDNVMDL